MSERRVCWRDGRGPRAGACCQLEEDASQGQASALPAAENHPGPTKRYRLKKPRAPGAVGYGVDTPILLGLLLLSLGCLEPAHAGPLQRTVDAVVVPGKMLGTLRGTPIHQIACLSARGERLEPIPCQVDERTASGAYVLTSGPEANPKDSDGRLSDQDELVFMARDTGPSLSAPTFPAGCSKATELEVMDPLDKGTGTLYLAACQGSVPRSSVDYVTYQPGPERVTGTGYVLQFSSVAPIVFDTLFIRREAGGSGRDDVDRMKIRLKAMVWGTIPIDKTEEDYTSEVIGYLDGPVRVLRRTRNRQVLFWKIPSPSAIQDNFFYDAFFEFPVVVSLPFDLDTFLSECDLRISLDSEAGTQRIYSNSRNPTPVQMDGKTSEAELALDRRPFSWSITRGADPAYPAGWFNRLTIKSNVDLAPELFYVDDSTLADGPESVAGQMGNVGYQMKNLKGLTKGTHVISSVLYTFPKYTTGIERRYLAIADHRLQVRVVHQD